MAMILLAAMLLSARCEEMTEEQIASAREEALVKRLLQGLDKPLEKMKIKELLALLSERGVECKDCNGAEKGEVVKQVVACTCKDQAA